MSKLKNTHNVFNKSNHCCERPRQAAPGSAATCSGLLHNFITLCIRMLLLVVLVSLLLVVVVVVVFVVVVVVVAVLL